MTLRTLALALATLPMTTPTIAQCGAHQLTTPPAFVANNGGAVGGMTYFTLDALATNGVRICGFRVNTSTSGDIHALVYRHQTITDVSLLTGANNTAADWCVIGCLRGAGLPQGTPSPMSVVSAGGAIDLPHGPHLLAIGDGNFDHRYTNGNGSNQTASDANLAFSAGAAANAVFSASLLSPRVLNVTFDYDVALSPITQSPCGALCVESSGIEFGTGCGGHAATIYELFDQNNPFDLQNGDLLLSANAGTVTATTTPGTPIVSPIGPDLGLGDDESSALIPLGFTLDAFGVCADSISVQSNGCIWLGSVGNGDYSPTVTEFESQAARIAACWTDLRPLAGGGIGTIHVDVLTGMTIVTYAGVAEWGTTNPITFQIEIAPTSIRIRYLASTTYPDQELVGFHGGVAQVNTPGSNLNGGAVLPVSGAPALTLSCVSRPVAGGSLDLTLLGTPSFGTVLVQVGFVSPSGTPLTAQGWAPNCFQYVQGGVALGLATTCSHQFSIGLPPGLDFVGLPIGCQGFALAASPFGLLASNGVNAECGNY